ncbi:hypothetical protein HWV62_31207 [Athelia sp. TMB]|nr:hypothetical protein HWV62_31207 [Athelia sp. TMB]
MVSSGSKPTRRLPELPTVTASLPTRIAIRAPPMFVGQHTVSSTRTEVLVESLCRQGLLGQPPTNHNFRTRLVQPAASARVYYTPSLRPRIASRASVARPGTALRNPLSERHDASENTLRLRPAATNCNVYEHRKRASASRAPTARPVRPTTANTNAVRCAYVPQPWHSGESLYASPLASVLAKQARTIQVRGGEGTCLRKGASMDKAGGAPHESAARHARGQLALRCVHLQLYRTSGGVDSARGARPARWEAISGEAADPMLFPAALPLSGRPALCGVRRAHFVGGIGRGNSTCGDGCGGGHVRRAPIEEMNDDPARSSVRTLQSIFGTGLPDWGFRADNRRLDLDNSALLCIAATFHKSPSFALNWMSLKRKLPSIFDDETSDSRTRPDERRSPQVPNPGNAVGGPSSLPIPAAVSNCAVDCALYYAENILPEVVSRAGDPQPLRFNAAPILRISNHFTGRDLELDLLSTALASCTNDEPARFAVHGMPGLGKSQLVLQFSKLGYASHIYTCVFWVSATTVEKLNRGLTGVLDLVDDRDRHHPDHAVRLLAARRWLEQSPHSWLLILDDVTAEVISFLREHLPHENTRGAIIFTTRTSQVAEAIVNAGDQQDCILELKPLTTEQSVALLAKASGLQDQGNKSDQESVERHSPNNLAACPWHWSRREPT